MRLKLTTGGPNEWDNMREMFRDFVGKRRQSPFEGQNDAHHVLYKRFRRRVTLRSSREAPAVSSPLASGRHCELSFEFDPVCQRLELDSPPRHRGPAQTVLHGNLHALERGVSHCGAVTSSNTPHTISAMGHPTTQHFSEQGWMWRAAVQEHDSAQQTGSDARRHDLQPFAVLDKAAVSLQGKSVMRLAAPSLQNDYYTNVLDCSCNGMIALALGSSVYLWNSETRALVGYLDPSPQTGRVRRHQSVSSLCWSRDGRALCIGTRRGEIQLWDVEKKQNMRCLPSHLSVVGALSWKHQLLSSGSVLGRIHHLDPRAPAPLVGAAVQKTGICSLQWSPGDDWLASGSTDGLLHIWDGDVAGLARSKQPVATMTQPTAVKVSALEACVNLSSVIPVGEILSVDPAMGWCPWQRKTIATGGGWKDGELRIWDTQSGTCVTSTSTNSQICSLRWAEKKRYLVTGHGLPHHQIICWTSEFPSLKPVYQLTGHSRRVLHVALNPDSTQIFSAAVDQCFHIWDL
ncbi:cell division cycle protein 20 homolog B isoform X2 [Seriola lalandi dorsalis]|uniref:cell division cycle protein 20 homolog B isoform X2 n=1 Tax=Seriola lalandi dorsalis TaxID=1841481 RepID=UPI000C6FA278|nr:cell division cycle protein 20 homolog B isoform X2 [Seriola lalandi dorsalis]